MINKENYDKWSYWGEINSLCAELSKSDLAKIVVFARNLVMEENKDEH